jgi:putative endopeptidase
MGRKFDHEGNLNDWWTPEDETNFLERAQVVIDQYNEFEVHGLNVDGDMTKGSCRPWCLMPCLY